MIKKFRVQNFESHNDTTLELSPGLNVIVGPTDAGKSSLFRALKWLMFNRPGGAWMVPLFDEKPGTTEVEVTLDDGRTIVKRKKRTGPAEYLIDGKRLTGFGTEVPSDVQSGMAMDEINFQAQIDLPFLMFDTAGERSRLLNRIAGLDDIDRCLANAESDTRRVRQDLESERTNLETYRKAKQQFADLDQREALVEEAERVEQEVTSTEALIEDIKTSLALLDRIDKESEEWSWVEDPKLANLLREGTQLKDEIADLSRSIRLLMKVIEALTSLDQSIEDAEKELNRLMKSLPKKCPACGKTLTPS